MRGDVPFRYNLNPFPWMRIAGKWQEEASFEPAQRARTQVFHGRFVITSIDEFENDHVGRHSFPILNPETGLRHHIRMPRKYRKNRKTK